MLAGTDVFVVFNHGQVELIVTIAANGLGCTRGGCSGSEWLKVLQAVPHGTESV
jgi:hypothetical protein